MNLPDARLVVNTSPLIHLAEAKLLHLLRAAAPIVWVPEPVAREIRAYGQSDPTAAQAPLAREAHRLRRLNQEVAAGLAERRLAEVPADPSPTRRWCG